MLSRSGRSRRIVRILGVLLSVLTAVVLTVPALAEEFVLPGGLTLRLAGHEIDERVVSVDVGGIPPGAASLSVRVNGIEATRAVVPDSASTLRVRLTVAGTRNVSAVAFDSAGAILASTEVDLVVNTTGFMPTYPRVTVYENGFVLPSQRIGLTTADASGVLVRIGGRRCTVVASADGKTYRIVLPGSLPSGRLLLEVRSRNAWNLRVLRLHLWSLKWAPTTSRAILVDKSDFTLYYAQNRKMKRVYPVATGMPGTPTHTGQFWLGAPGPAGGAWGVLRMALSKSRGTGRLPAWGGYYIHGTSQPDSIGTQASHGCVRMYNRDVVALSRLTRHHLVRVTIRR